MTKNNEPLLGTGNDTSGKEQRVTDRPGTGNDTKGKERLVTDWPGTGNDTNDKEQRAAAWNRKRHQWQRRASH